jgi:hypothetical protein
MASSELPAPILAPVSIGELVDKITILRIKEKHLSGNALDNVLLELSLLESTLASVPVQPPVELILELSQVNQTLWDIEDRIRDQERIQCFDDSFIQLARSVYVTNDQRASLKKQINAFCGSLLVEEKGYASY